MLQLLAESDALRPAALRAGLVAHGEAVRRGARRDNHIVARVEAAVRAAPEDCIRFDASGHATIVTPDGTFAAGRFETPALGVLRERAEAAQRSAGTAGTLRLFVLDGASPATDIGSLQATAPDGAMFQVASQFNCLEAPDPCVVPVAEYLTDPTQGPRAAISAFPGVFVRHYAATRHDGTRFVQRTDGPQIDLLEAVCAGGVAAVSNGYLLTDHIARPEDFARALEDRFDDIRIGVHDEIEVVLGHNWAGAVHGSRTIAQTLCSALAGGGYSEAPVAPELLERVIRSLQRAAHLGTLLAAAGLGKSYVVLTLVGGGVFGNPVPVIWDAILAAVDSVRPLLSRDLTVVVNGYSIGRRVPHDELAAAAAARGGTCIVFDDSDVHVYGA
jgi:hypothetical protein